MPQFPFYLGITAILTTVITVFLAARALAQRRNFLIITALWLAMQAGLGISGFYQHTAGLPPRFMLTLGPPLIAIIGLFATRAGRQAMDNMNLKALTLLHIVRIPVELMLWGLYLHKAVPRLMTFEGGNLDILSGISAVAMYYLCFRGGCVRKKALIIWNVACLILLVNIVVRAVLSAPFPFQQMGFEQPNVAVLYFPFVWLAACIVPLVLLSHLAALRQLIKGKTASAIASPLSGHAEPATA